MYNVLEGVGGAGSLIWASKNDFQNRSTAPSQGADQSRPQLLPSLSNTDRQKGADVLWSLGVGERAEESPGGKMAAR